MTLLKGSVYQSLALQTRLKPYLDQIGLNVTETGVALDFGAPKNRSAANEARWRMFGRTE